MDDNWLTILMFVVVFTGMGVTVHYESKKEMQLLEMEETQRKWRRDSTMKAMELQKQYHLDSIELVIKHKIDLLKK